MSGPSAFGRPPSPRPRGLVRPRNLRQGVALALVCGAVFAAGAATGTWDGPPQTRVPLSADSVSRDDGRRTAAGGDERTPAHDPADEAEDAARTAPDALPEALSEALDEGGLAPDDAKAIVSRSGDRWAAFYTEQEYEDFQRTLDGEYVGVGLWVRRTGPRSVVVSQVQAGGPADAGGVRAGDRLVSIDGEPVGDRPVTEVVSLLRGGGGAGAQPDTAVVLGLERDGERREVVLRRTVLDAQDVTVGDMGGGVTRITVSSFTRGVGERVREAMALPRVKEGAAGGGGVVLDLRGNDGGLVAEATETASVFLDGGLVATYDARGEQRALFAKPGGDTRTPLVVLVDGGTMSAAEMLAGALQDRGRAVVVGSRTFGKGSVQEPSTLADGSVVEVTVGTYRTPSGRTVDGDGVRPDLEVDAALGPEAAEEQARTVLSGLGPRS